MMDIFFISYRESNAEENWLRVKSLHRDAIRIHGVSGIDRIHLACNSLATTEFFWTVDGDNSLTQRLVWVEPIDVDLLMFKAIDPLSDETTSLGAVKLWRRDSFINKDMSKGDFTLNATATKRVVDDVFSVTAYNASKFDAWKTSFRHCVKLLSVILSTRRSADNINMYLDRWRATKHCYAENAGWAYQGYLDAVRYVERYDNNMVELNKINDYDWLQQYFEDSHGHIL